MKGTLFNVKCVTGSDVEQVKEMYTTFEDALLAAPTIIGILAQLNLIATTR